MKQHIVLITECKMYLKHWFVFVLKCVFQLRVGLRESFNFWYVKTTKVINHDVAFICLTNHLMFHWNWAISTSWACNLSNIQTIYWNLYIYCQWNQANCEVLVWHVKPLFYHWAYFLVSGLTKPMKSNLQ